MSSFAEEEDEILALERAKAESIHIMDGIEAALGDREKVLEYIAEYGEREGEWRYQNWRTRAKRRIAHERKKHAGIKSTLLFMRAKRAEVELLSEVFYAIGDDPDLQHIRLKIWRLLATYHKVYLKREGELDDNAA